MNNQLIDMIRQIKSDPKFNNYKEAKVKQTIILRILNILGWDPYNANEIIPELSVGGKRVDYSLRIDDKDKAFIEVKNAGEPLEDHQEQLLEYAFKQGVSLAILTNGKNWWFYLPLMEGSWEQRRFYALDLFDQDEKEIASKFIDLLSKEKLRTGESIDNAKKILENKNMEKLINEIIPKAWHKLLAEMDDDFIELLSKKVEDLCGYRPKIESIENFIGTLATPKPSETGTINQAPTYQKISSFELLGQRYEVDKWIEMLLKLSEVMAHRHSNEFEKVLDLKGSKRPYFTKNKNALRIPRKINKTDIYVETNLSANSIVKISKDLIKLFGYKENDLKIFTQ